MLKIETWLDGVGLKAPIAECPAWPPDLFALAGTLIRRSGAYLRVFERRDVEDYPTGIRTAAQEWRERLDAIPAAAQDISASDLQGARTLEIRQGWERLIQKKGIAVSAINDHPDLAEALIRLTLIADEASAGIGISWDPDKPSQFLSMAQRALTDSGARSFCWDVPRDVLCVLGKQHTPVKGATFRSLSHHLALYQPSEIEARWVTLIPKTGKPALPRRGLNLLLLPWPERIDTEDFQVVWPGVPQPDRLEPPGYFRYEPKHYDAPRDFKEKLEKALESAQVHTGGPIDAVVFPELALTEEQFDVAEEVAFEKRCILICGVRQARTTVGDWDSNVSVLQAAGAVRGAKPESDDADLRESLQLYQAKHHRWYLDRTQIVSYQLASGLPPSQGAWEHIELVPPRVLHFVTLHATTWSVLICEDLARQDPAGDLIRAVGPNLLIALLMDGPQLSSRWPARYAAVLAEDPGTSVLTLTSLGMAERSRPILSGQRASISRVIGLWRDAIQGETQIALDSDHNACVLSLEYDKRTEYCADGRSDHGQTCYPVYAGHRSFKIGA